MKVRWVYTCDENHRWEFFRDENAEELPKDLVRPSGDDAVTLQKLYPADEVQITIEPAAFKTESNEIYGERNYRFILTERVGGDEGKISQKTYLWRDVLNLAEKFHGLTKEKAWNLWEKLNP